MQYVKSHHAVAVSLVASLRLGCQTTLVGGCAYRPASDAGETALAAPWVSADEFSCQTASRRAASSDIMGAGCYVMT
jgi:hypothetical protein